VRVVGISNGRIPWPLASKPGRGGRSFVLYGDLAKAVRREAGVAVAYWWGVRADTVSRWRKALGVGRTTKGSHVLKSAYTREPWARAAWKKARLMAKSPAAIAKIAATMRGGACPSTSQRFSGGLTWAGKPVQDANQARAKMNGPFIATGLTSGDTNGRLRTSTLLC
jgi:hypothetical protein